MMQLMDVEPNSDLFNNTVYYIGHSRDESIRYKSSSGGVGTAIIKYLLEQKEYGTSMTFIFNAKECCYTPKLIYDFKDYNNCGSVYQETDTIGFIRSNIYHIKDGIIVTCMPCQVKAIRSILTRNGIRHFIISLCCSGQTTVQGTWYYYKLLGINKQDVRSIQYRGNGWPSGIQIRLNNGKDIKMDNYTYPWTIMHESLLFRPKRCLFCTIKTSPDADVSLADPWLKEYINNDKIGSTIVLCNSTGDRIIKNMCDDGFLVLCETSESTYLKSQLGTVQEKERSNQFEKFNRIVIKMGEEGTLYKSIVTSSVLFLKLHLKVLRILKHILKHN